MGSSHPHRSSPARRRRGKGIQECAPAPAHGSVRGEAAISHVHWGMAQTFAVYILASQRNGTLYIGVTGNLALRMEQHRSKAVPGFTRRYAVTRLVYVERFDDPRDAIAR